MSFHFIKYCSFWFIILLYIGFPPLPTPLCHLQFLGVVGGEMPSDDGVWWCRRELDHIKDWVKPFHGLRQVETIGIVPNLSFDGEGSEMPVRELLRWSGGLNVAGIEVNLVSWVMLWCSNPLLIVLPSHIIFQLG